jgi:hypothetical protein
MRLHFRIAPLYRSGVKRGVTERDVGGSKGLELDRSEWNYFKGKFLDEILQRMRIRAVNRFALFRRDLRCKAPRIRKSIPISVTEVMVVSPANPVRKIFQNEAKILGNNSAFVLNPATHWTLRKRWFLTVLKQPVDAAIGVWRD